MIIPKNKPYVHLIGQDKDKTIIHLNLNVGSKLTGKEKGGKTAYWEHSVHNPSSPVYKYEGSVVVVKGDHFYTENISYVNDWGVLSDNGPQALAMNSQADCASFYNCKFRSFQDTWTPQLQTSVSRFTVSIYNAITKSITIFGIFMGRSHYYCSTPYIIKRTVFQQHITTTIKIVVMHRVMCWI